MNGNFREMLGNSVEGCALRVKCVTDSHHLCLLPHDVHKVFDVLPRVFTLFFVVLYLSVPFLHRLESIGDDLSRTLLDINALAVRTFAIALIATSAHEFGILFCVFAEIVVEIQWSDAVSGTVIIMSVEAINLERRELA